MSNNNTFLVELKPIIAKVEGSINEFESGQLKRIRVFFYNNWSLSLVSGAGSYSSKGNFEVAVIDPEGNLDYSLTYGDVLSHQEKDDIIELSQKVLKL